MGYIKLTSVFFSPTATGNQTVRIEYKLASSSGSFILVNNAAPVLANGNFNPEITIPSLVDGETYTVKVTNLCNGSVQAANFQVGQQCTSFTVRANTGGATVQWEDCQTGSPQEAFLADAQQITFCTRSQTGYTVSFGAVTQVANNGNCQN